MRIVSSKQYFTQIKKKKTPSHCPEKLKVLVEQLESGYKLQQ